MARRNRRRKRNRERQQGGGPAGRGGGRRGGGGGRSGPTVVMVMDRPGEGSGRARSSGNGGGNRTMRGGNGGGRRRDYAEVTKDVGVQLGCEVGEVTGALLVGAMDAVSAASDSKTDDFAFPIVQKAVGSGMRALGDMYLAKRHAGLAKVVSAMGSSINGAVTYSYLQRQGLRVQKRMKETA